MNKKIAIIGGGNLGTAIAEGLIQSGFVLPKHILITKRNIQTLHDDGLPTPCRFQGGSLALLRRLTDFLQNEREVLP